MPLLLKEDVCGPPLGEGLKPPEGVLFHDHVVAFPPAVPVVEKPRDSVGADAVAGSDIIPPLKVRLAAELLAEDDEMPREAVAVVVLVLEN